MVAGVQTIWIAYQADCSTTILIDIGLNSMWMSLDDWFDYGYSKMFGVFSYMFTSPDKN